MKRNAKKRLNLAKTCGCSNRVLTHNWNIFMIVLCTWYFILYYTKTFGYYNVRRGLLTTPAIVFPEIPAALLYLYSLCSGKEFAYVLMQLYKVSMVNCVIAITCMLLDFAFY